MDINIQSVEQGRADYAYRCVQDVKGRSYASEYKSYAKKIPSLIKTNGLGATLAFIKGKGGEAYNKLYKHISNWLKKDPKRIANIEDNDDLVKYIVGIDSYEYRVITTEVLVLMKWISRFCDGLIEGE